MIGKIIRLAAVALGILIPASAADAGVVVRDASLEVPLMTRLDHSPALRLQIISTTGEPYVLKDLKFKVYDNMGPKAIESASVFFGNRSDQYRRALPDSLVATIKPKKEKLNFRLNTIVDADTLYCWLTLHLRDDAATAAARVNVICEEVKTSEGSLQFSGMGRAGVRVGVALRRPGEDGVNTSRIPGLDTSDKGTLLALYDARNERDDDLQGDIDIAINRSTDGGKTWGPIIKAIDMGCYGGLPERYNGVSDGAILCDRKNGVIYATGLWMHGILDPKTGKWVENLNDTSTVWNHQWRAHGSQPGYGIKQSSQYMIVKSTDDGLTWSEPVNITRQVKKEKNWLLAPGPGRGIVMEDGTLVFPAEGRDSVGQAFSTIIYSRDGGNTWTAGEPATWNTNECQVVELSDHSLMLNARHRANRRLQNGNGRAIAVTHDMGKTWTEHPTSRKALIEPACQGGFFRHDYVRDGEKRHILIFTNPSDKNTRINHTLKVSFDDGETWPEEYWIPLDSEFGAGYSCITDIDPETIGIFYEGSQADIQFQAIPLSDILHETGF